MSTITVKQYDQGVTIATVLSDASGAVDVSGAQSIQLIAKKRGAAAPVIDAAMTADGATQGRVTYDTVDGDLDTPGDFRMEIRVVWGNGVHRRFPSVGWDTLSVLPASAPAPA